jgi:hypothetical protein
VSLQEDAILAYWTEHRQQLRQSESQRAVLTNYVLVIASTLPLSILIVVIGLYGAATAAKYHERADYHLSQARALTRTLKDIGALTDADAHVEEYREAHYQKFPRLHRLRLHSLWTGLHLGVSGYGLVLIVITLAW